MKLCLYSFLVSIFLISCARETIKHKVRFYGNVEDMFTRYPIANAGISIYLDYASYGSTLTTTYEDLGTTDANGDYDFKMKKRIKDKDFYGQYMRFSGRGIGNFLYSDQLRTYSFTDTRWY